MIIRDADLRSPSPINITTDLIDELFSSLENSIQ